MLAVERKLLWFNLNVNEYVIDFFKVYMGKWTLLPRENCGILKEENRPIKGEEYEQ